MNFYNNGNTGLQVSGLSTDNKALWPSHNTIKNCTSMNNADRAMEDADGFAAKLTTGEATSSTAASLLTTPMTAGISSQRLQPVPSARSPSRTASPTRTVI